MTGFCYFSLFWRRPALKSGSLLQEVWSLGVADEISCLLSGTA